MIWIVQETQGFVNYIITEIFILDRD